MDSKTTQNSDEENQQYAENLQEHIEQLVDFVEMGHSHLLTDADARTQVIGMVEKLETPVKNELFQDPSSNFLKPSEMIELLKLYNSVLALPENSQKTSQEMHTMLETTRETYEKSIFPENVLEANTGTMSQVPRRVTEVLENGGPLEEHPSAASIAAVLAARTSRQAPVTPPPNVPRSLQIGSSAEGNSSSSLPEPPLLPDDEHGTSC